MDSAKKLTILYFGSDRGNSGSRVCGLRALGHRVEFAFEKDPIEAASPLWRSLEWRLCNGPATFRLNRLFLERAVECDPDVVWVEMGKLLYARTLRKIKEQVGCLLINTFSDDFRSKVRSNRSRHYDRSIQIYDHIFTPRDVNFSELDHLGARAVGKFWKGFDPNMHFPEELTDEDKKVYGTDVAFIGHGEANRVEALEALAREISGIKVWGNGWQRFEIPRELRPKIMFRGPEFAKYRKALCGAKIALHFLSQWNRDTQSSRSFEIPACGVFMLAERTDDHLASFEEDKEAVFFSSTEEMVDKAKYYLKNDEARDRIAKAGYRRCMESGYSNHDRVRVMLEEALGGVDDSGKNRGTECHPIKVSGDSDCLGSP